ncbi:MAG: efflux RND transporter permease subunit, partial [Planctomycetota bacterium JB042]
MTDREAARRGGLFAFTTRRPVATTMAVLAVAVFGGISLTKTPLELLPEISYPTITVRTEYQGAGPEDMEERISKPIEETLAVLPGLEAHSSISRSGVSDVVLEFRWGTNLSFATQDIRERLDRTRLPDDADPPLILRYDPSLDPVMRIAVFGEGDQREVRRAADEIVARGLATVPGVAAVKVRGGLETEIRVRLDAKRIASLGLDISEVDRRLKIENVNLASGTLVEGDTEYLVRTLNQFESIDEILRLSVTDRDGQPIRIRDLATVTRTHKKRDVVTRVDGREAVELLVHREADANIVRLAQEVRDRLLGTDAQRRLLAEIAAGTREDPEVRLADALRAEEEKKDAAPAAQPERRGAGGRGGFGRSESDEVKKLREEVKEKRAAEEVLSRKLPRGMETAVLSDQSRFIDEAIDEVRGAAIIGGLLAVLVLLLFLKSAAATAIIAVAIPVSIIATFAPMFMVGTTLNIMSLGGLALGVGMLVDNSIVVLESIFRCREEGDDRGGSSVRGTEEVGGAVFASTLTTIAVFFPIVFVSGVAGQLFGDQALTVVFSLLSSLVVALFFIPMLAARGRDGGGSGSGTGGPLRLLLDVATPIVLPHRTLAASSFRANLGPRRGVARAAIGLPLLPVAIVHAVVEVAARLLLTLLLVLLFVVVLAVRLFTLVVRVAGAPFQFVFDRVFGLVNAAYPRVLRAILVRPTLVFAVLVVALAGGGLALRTARTLGTEMLPTVHQGELVAHVYLPVGTPIERTARALAPIERDLLALPEVEQVASAVGVGRDEIADPDEGGHSARVLVRLSPSAADAVGEERAIAAMRGVLGGRPELTGFRFSRPTLFSIKAPLEVHARGDDLETLRVAAGDIVRRMQGTPSLTDVRSTVTRGNPEVRLSFDREKLRRYGLDLEAIANRIRAQVQGVVSTRFADEEQRIDVRVLSDVDSVDALLELTVNRGRAVGLSDTLDRGAEGGGGS